MQGTDLLLGTNKGSQSICSEFGRDGRHPGESSGGKSLNNGQLTASKPYVSSSLTNTSAPPVTAEQAPSRSFRDLGKRIRDLEKKIEQEENTSTGRTVIPGISPRPFTSWAEKIRDLKNKMEERGDKSIEHTAVLATSETGKEPVSTESYGPSLQSSPYTSIIKSDFSPIPTLCIPKTSQRLRMKLQ